MFRKQFPILVGLVLLCHFGFSQLNVTFRSNLKYPGAALSNIGGYVDSLNNEYALVGYEFGLSIVNVTNPDSPYVAFNVPGAQSEWREVKTWGTRAYVTTEAGGGLQIVNLQYLPDSIQYHAWNGDGAINGNLHTIHSLHIDNGYVYLHGSNLFSGATVIANLNNPDVPHYEGYTPTTYVHDGYVRNDTLWAAHIYDGYFSVIDVSNKANPIQLMAQNTPTNFTHNTWLNDAGSVLFTTDENAYSYLASYDVSDIFNIQELDRVQVTPGSGSIVHNTHTLNDYEIVSWYKDGIAIVDASHPDNLVVTGWYDTDTLESGDGFSGCWGVYPYLPSGNLVASDINGGLWVLTPNYVRACYLEGMVTDSVTSLPLQNVTIQILNTSISEQNKITGDYKTGYATAGTYTVKFSKAGYRSKIVTGVVLQNGQLTVLDAALAPLTPFTLNGRITNSQNGSGIGNVQVSFQNNQYNYSTATNSNGDFTINNFYEDSYDFTAGKWGFVTTCNNGVTITASSGLYTASLTPGYYDDFTFDFGWVASGNNSTPWEVGVPVETSYNGIVSAPGSDSPNDCGGRAFVTDNGGGTATSSDVDGSSAILTSPSFDLTGILNPHIEFDYWYYNVATTFGPANDTLIIRLNNGTSTVVIDRIDPQTPGMGTWVYKNYDVTSFLTPTANMHLSLSISDTPPVYNLTEAGIDHFRVTAAAGIGQHEADQVTFDIAPNPSFGQSTITFEIPGLQNGAWMEVRDLSGRLIQQYPNLPNKGVIQFGNELSAGTYLLSLHTEEGVVSNQRYMRIH